MDWEYFRDEKAGKFKVKRLPPIRKPIRVTDRTDLSTERELFRGLGMAQGVEEYKHAFGDALSYEPELDDIENAMNRASEAELGPLAPFRGQFETAFDLLDRLAEEGWLDQSVQIGEKLAHKAEQGGLVERFHPDSFGSWSAYWMTHTMQELKATASELGLRTSGKKAELASRLAEHVSKNPTYAPQSTLVRATPALAEAVQAAINGILEKLDIKLREYPPGYQQAVWSEIRTDWDGEHWDIEKAIPDHENSNDTPLPARRPTGYRNPKPTPRRSADSASNHRRSWIVLAVTVLIAWLLLR